MASTLTGYCRAASPLVNPRRVMPTLCRHGRELRDISMTRLLNWLNDRLPNGIYATVGRSCVIWCHSKLSFHDHLKRCVRTRLQVPAGQKTPQWFSEMYQLTWILAEGALLYGSQSPRRWLSSGAAVLAVYRSFDILLFAAAWVFIDGRPVHSYRRSLAGFLLNVADVVVCFTVAGIGFGCVSGEGIWQAIYSSLRTTVTIGPLPALEPACSGCFALTSAQIAASYFLAAVVIAAAVGSLRRRDAQAAG